ncbi:MAG: TIM barrel protein, partial [Candidatus Hydrogenedentes bacterium]|nr:TIM barrel protein [Candidatus Hydrogenedentota bacterium]
MTRRRLLQTATGAVLAGMMPAARAAGADQPAPREGCTFSIGTYAMKDLPVEQAIGIIADAGFDGIEIGVAADWNAAPGRMPAERRRAVRDLIQQRGLALTALMEHLYPAEDDARHAADLERLRGVFELAHDLAPDAAPLVQTVLGGGDWEGCKERFRDRLADWVRIGQEAGTVIAIKPHRGG